MKIYMDFSGILAMATLALGLVWLLDICLLKPKRRAASARQGQVGMARGGESNKDVEPKLVEYARSFFPILLIVFILRSFLVEPFRIPSGSMKPTLLEGDFILVNKYVYGLRLPIFGTKLLNIHEPKTGDIIVFRFPKNTSIDFIKRVVGVPGDKISYKDKILYINGKPVDQKFIGYSEDVDMSGQRQVKQISEALFNVDHSIYIHPGYGSDMDEVSIPQGMYFVMGDNRDNSEDSRVWGFVPEELILGKAFFIWMSWDHQSKDIRWQRIGHKIK